jgi:hypothetical protein
MRLQQYISEENKNIDKIWHNLSKDCKPFLKEMNKSIPSGDKNALFYRGYDSFRSGAIGLQKKKPRTNRQPKDTPRIVHKILDDAFYRVFKWSVRSEGLFTTSQTSYADNYGTLTIFFPIGNYKYVWSSKIKDLYYYIGEGNIDYIEDALRDEPGWDYKNEYENEYGEGEKGIWDYDGLEVEYREDITEPDGEFYDPDFDENKFQWIPDVEWDDYIDQRNSDIIDEFDDIVYKAIKTFKNNDMKGALKSCNEVMFKCDEYYLVEAHHADDLINLIRDYK